MAQGNGMSRLSRLYARVEQMRSLERRSAAHAVEEASAAISMNAAAGAHALADARASLGAGDREQWAIAQATQTLRWRHQQHLAQLCAEREKSLTDAVEVHRESRLAMEQAERLMVNAASVRGVVEARREQAIADDRFASRAAWRRANTAE